LWIFKITPNYAERPVVPVVQDCERHNKGHERQMDKHFLGKFGVFQIFGLVKFFLLIRIMLVKSYRANRYQLTKKLREEIQGAESAGTKTKKCLLKNDSLDLKMAVGLLDRRHFIKSETLRGFDHPQ
jgi:hypothetical protein